MTVLSGADLELPPRAAVLARFAVTLTARPWALTPDVVDDMAAQGYDEDAIEAAAGVAGTFNYLTRVADASGIEFDYDTPLPRFEPEVDREPEPRPADRDTWPVVPAGRRTFVRLPGLIESWQRWREYVFDSDEPLSRRERGVLARTAAEETCDRWRAEELAECRPRDERERLLARFAGKLSRAPWRMRPADLDELRAAGYPEVALLHAIATVALQNAESRVAMALAVIAARAVA